MYPRVFGVFFLATLIAVGTAGCSDDGDPEPGDDGGKSDLVANDLAADGNTSPDLSPDAVSPDMEINLIYCDPECASAGLTLCVHEEGGQGCVECLSDEDCQQNPFARGPTCDVANQICTCQTDADCADNSYGTHCDAATSRCLCSEDAHCTGAGFGRHCDTLLGACNCYEDSECTAPEECIGVLDGTFAITTVCQTPCVSDVECRSAASPFCNPSSGKCGECTENDHCADHPNGDYCLGKAAGKVCTCIGDESCSGDRAWGNGCTEISLSEERCGCTSDAECVGNANGPYCSWFLKCSCLSDSQCATEPYTSCALPYVNASYMYCQEPCTADTDCEGKGPLNRCHPQTHKCAACLADSDCTDPDYPYCNANVGRCVTCTTDADCPSYDAPRCDASVGDCVFCLEDADCADHPFGTVCRLGACTCNDDSDCQGGYPWGGACMGDPGDKRCGCSADSHCAGNPHGPSCDGDLDACSCADDTQCTSDPYSLCSLLADVVEFKHCQKPCTSNQDCIEATVGLQVCDTNSGRCLACLTDSDCTDNPFNDTCLADQSGCVECVDDSQCDSAALGSTCLSNACVCQSDADCQDNLNGHVCDGSYAACSCSSDADCPSDRSCSPSEFVGVNVCQ